MYILIVVQIRIFQKNKFNIVNNILKKRNIGRYASDKCKRYMNKRIAKQKRHQKIGNQTKMYLACELTTRCICKEKVYGFGNFQCLYGSSLSVVLNFGNRQGRKVEPENLPF